MKLSGKEAVVIEVLKRNRRAMGGSELCRQSGNRLCGNGIHATLRRMEAKDFVRTADGDPSRRKFVPTEAGLQALVAWQEVERVRYA
jgi:hypothetical protein